MRLTLTVAVGSFIGLFGLSSATSSSHTSSVSFGLSDSSCFQPIFENHREQNTINTALSIRGGEVREPTTLADVQAIILKASAEGKLVVIDFSATWCGPCKMIAPVYEEFSNLMPNVVFLKVDVDQNAETAAYYKVSSMPTFVFVKKGENIDTMIGANAQNLKSLIEKYA
mmetsp:Transcript_20206/g.19452  ORF Transcript_20206/g.19452 Transcript_20206/m.19452 type:complete len:170 (-) Transcript_20206:234-743(-)|eukprot:CAMPEP_0197833830 /NCGR_PEP_ID=MMETSP1437-20131217/20229_1 /TAXON_ID=49252 ORGANISM="Eucampia antarctica, Strain CCMP1452" /NCGR_SAMPLE_ID=MMETSP1437 /ASSEMBLY_ACC=CAM_ASM_001096 /LENGTH=169 /DNA_ID=CAMNT_0043438105 /DNA_START=17 /DNA_END=526 /DNA_ORIENTATION=+